MFTLNACPKPQHKRKTPKRADIGKFDKATRLTIIQRDNGFCVRCGRLYEEIHHIIYRSALGKGTVDNGACVCGSCHRWAHSGRAGREWFENFRKEKLI